MNITSRFRFALPVLLAVTIVVTPLAQAKKHPALEATAKRIKNTLRSDAYLSRFKLDTDTVANHIELDGKVNTFSQRGRAFTIARRVAPRAAIINKIDVDFKHRQGR